MTEQEFHKKRIGLVFTKYNYYNIGNLSHKEWIDTHNNKITTIKKLDFENIVRGYLLNDILHLYIGSNFEAPLEIPVTVLTFISRFKVKAIYLGCIKDEIGKIWQPIKIIKLNK